MNIVQGKPLVCPYVFIVPFYNQITKIKRCINSILIQNRALGFGIALIDDGSTDGSLTSLPPIDVPYVVGQNKTRLKKVPNMYHGVRELIANPNTVVLELDGDDFLAQEKVVDIIHEKHSKGYLQTFGSFNILGDNYAKNGVGIIPIAHDVAQPWNLDKCHAWAHLRTFRKWLYEKVELDYFVERDTKDWLLAGEDITAPARMIEMSNGNACFISDILYNYDTSNSESTLDEDSRKQYMIDKLYRIPTGNWFKRIP